MTDEAVGLSPFCGCATRTLVVENSRIEIGGGTLCTALVCRRRNPLYGAGLPQYTTVDYDSDGDDQDEDDAIMMITMIMMMVMMKMMMLV